MALDTRHLTLTLHRVVSAIIVAAGRGTRMGSGTDKLFIEANAMPIVAHTWRRFDYASCIDEIVLVVREDAKDCFSDLARKFGFRKSFKLAPGGAERQDSVWNGLEAISPQADIVAIQDGARPCTTERLIEATIQAAREVGAAVAAQPMADTVKESNDGQLISRTLDRSRLWAVQTPQTFQTAIIRRALAEVRRKGLRVTDDTAACEVIGQPVRLVSCPDPNPKVTRPEDLACIEAMLKQEWHTPR